ncbi:hypothetical protein Syun_028007 [Stephania yunnanensis]|uniref:Methyltransferase type 11 domain-containing protein n=1 Tax=Stephania yunnanensis TaxID=152371 RepID=A0AAP0EGK0_9MAGN
MSRHGSHLLGFTARGISLASSKAIPVTSSKLEVFYIGNRDIHGVRIGCQGHWDVPTAYVYAVFDVCYEFMLVVEVIGAREVVGPTRQCPGGRQGSRTVIVATTVHWFDLPRLYSIVKRLLRKPGGIIAVWGYKPPTIDDAPPSLELIMKDLFEKSFPYWHHDFSLVLDEYKTLLFPFESVGLGSEGEPQMVEMKKYRLKDFYRHC